MVISRLVKERVRDTLAEEWTLYPSGRPALNNVELLRTEDVDQLLPCYQPWADAMIHPHIGRNDFSIFRSHWHDWMTRADDGKQVHLTGPQISTLLQRGAPRQVRSRCIALSGPRWDHHTIAELVYAGADMLVEFLCTSPDIFEHGLRPMLHAACPLSPNCDELAPLFDMLATNRQHPLYENYHSPYLDAPTVSLGTVLRALAACGGPTIPVPPGGSDWYAPWEDDLL